MSDSFQFGISKIFPCNYLPDQNERLLIAVDERLNTSTAYNALMAQGFRRSGNQTYRPYCPNCTACQSVRILVDEFAPTKGQRKISRRNSHLQIRIGNGDLEQYYPLYANYINTIHVDGAMYPADKTQYLQFIKAEHIEQLFIELWHDDELVSVAVTDVLADALSAMYTFYHPDYRKSSLGIFSILTQIAIAQEKQLKYLYLGYQVDGCQKMNYKTQYFPHEILRDNCWHLQNK